MTTIYCVWFKDHGYYAKNQPTYEWCFTPDKEKANVYQTLDGAYARGEYSSKYGDYEIHEFVVSIEFVRTHGMSTALTDRELLKEKQLEQKIARDKHIGPSEFSLSHVQAAKIRAILENAFGKDWRKSQDSLEALLQSDGFDRDAVQIVMNEIVPKAVNAS